MLTKYRKSIDGTNYVNEYSGVVRFDDMIPIKLKKLIRLAKSKINTNRIAL